MSEEGVLAGIVAGFILGFLVGLVVMDLVNPYKKGQIDALTGNVKYELIVKPDSTRVWEEIDE